MNVRPTHFAMHTAASAYELFKLGWGTDRIAEYWQISEAEAERRLTVERCQVNRLPSPYEAGR